MTVITNRNRSSAPWRWEGGKGIPFRFGVGNAQARSFEENEDAVKIRPWTRRRDVMGTALSIAGIVLLLILHYASSMRSLGLHDLLRRLLYIPVITAAIAGGKRGAMLAAAVATLGYIPHLSQLAAAGDRAFDSVMELVLLPVVGLLVGGFADSSRRARVLATERGRLAALGEVASVLIAQVEGPLASISGQAESLRFLAERTQSCAVAFGAEIIEQNVERTRRFLLDLERLGRPAKRRVTRVDLSALLSGIALQIRRSSPSGNGLVLGTFPRNLFVEADRCVLSFALRSLLLGLVNGVPGTRKVRAGISEDPKTGNVDVTVVLDGEHLPDLEQSLSAVFGAGTSEYNFERAICTHLLKAEGASLSFRRVSDREGIVRVRFRRATGNVSTGRRLPAYREAQGWAQSAGGRK